jgi:GATA zinc finger
MALHITALQRSAACAEPHMQVCKNCGTDCTPFWRTDQTKDNGTLCNACGLYLAKSGSMRPAALWKLDKAAKYSASAQQPAPEPSAGPTAPQAPWLQGGTAPQAMRVMGRPCYVPGGHVLYVPMAAGMGVQSAGPSAADLLRGACSAPSGPTRAACGAPLATRPPAPASAQRRGGRPGGNGSSSAARPPTPARLSPAGSTLPPLAVSAPARAGATAHATGEPDGANGSARDPSMVMHLSQSLANGADGDQLVSGELAMPDDDLHDMDMFVQAAQAIGIGADDIDDVLIDGPHHEACARAEMPDAGRAHSPRRQPADEAGPESAALCDAPDRARLLQPAGAATEVAASPDTKRDSSGGPAGRAQERALQALMPDEPAVAAGAGGQAAPESEADAAQPAATGMTGATVKSAARADSAARAVEAFTIGSTPRMTRRRSASAQQAN